jgi:hypothetical protein
MNKKIFIKSIKLHYPKIISGAFFLLLLGSYLSTFAIGSPYQPGATLDPACTPGETNCIVSYDLTFFKQDGNSFAGTATLGTNDSNHLVFETAATERMRLTSSGNLLIGTTTDSGTYKLDVNGAVRIGSAITFTSGTNSFMSSGRLVLGTATTSGSSATLQIGASSGITSAMEAFGRVSISDSVDNSVALSVSAGRTTGNLYAFNATAYSGSGSNTQGTAVWANALGSTNNIHYYAGNNDPSSITGNWFLYDTSARNSYSGGRLALGTNNTTSTGIISIRDTASQMMHIGSTNANGNYIVFYNETTASQTGFLGYGPTLFTSAAITDFGIRTAGGFVISQGSTVGMYMSSSRNFIIGNGVTDAGYKLDVTGTGRFTSQLLLTGSTGSTPSSGSYATAGLVLNITSAQWSAGQRPGLSFWGSSNSGSFLYYNASSFKAINDGGTTTTFAMLENGQTFTAAQTFSSTITATATGHRLGNLEIVTTEASAPTTAVGIGAVNNGPLSFTSGGPSSSLLYTYRFRGYYGTSGMPMTGSATGQTFSSILLDSGFALPTYNNSTGIMLNINAPINLVGNAAGTTTIKGIVYNPILTNTTGLTTHIALETVTGDVRLGSTSGTVSIGNTNNTYKLEVGSASVSGIVARFVNSTGTCDINPTTTSLACSSDRNLKKNIQSLDTSILDKVLSLNPVTYNWNTESDSTPLHNGFIAQEVESIFPDLVFTDATTGLKSLNYMGLIPYTVKALQEINLQIADISSLDLQNSNSLGSHIKIFLADVGNGIEKIFSKEIETQNLCVSDGNGTKTCITKAQLDALLQGSGNQQPSNPDPIPEEEVTPPSNEEVAPPEETTPPVEEVVPPTVPEVTE